MNDITEKIWNDFNKELKGFILQKVRDESVADDILQDVFIKIINNEDKVSKANSLQQYIYGIARNAVYDHFRNTTYTENFDEIKEPFSEKESESLNTTIAECCIKPFIKQLPGKYQTALHKTEFEGLSQKDLAKKLNISYSGAKSRVQRGREKLKEMILNCCAYQTDIYGNLMEPEEDKNCNC